MISRNLNREHSSSFDPDASNVPVNPQLDSGSAQRSCGTMCVLGLGIAGNCNERLKIQLEQTGLDYHNLQVTDYGYVEKVFNNLLHKLSRSENDEMFDLQINVLIWELFMSTTMKSAVHLWPRTSTKLDRVQEYGLRGAQDVVRYHLKADGGKFIRNSEFL